MYYNLIKSPAVIKTGEGALRSIDSYLRTAHLYFSKKILITQENLYAAYRNDLDSNDFADVVLVRGGTVDETEEVVGRIKDQDALAVAFGGGSVLDIVKYSASRCDVPYITVPSALSNDAVYSCVARLTVNGKKKSFGVQPPIGVIVDFDVIRKSPRVLLLAGVADVVSNLSALKDWKLAHKNIGEPINELAYMLSKESVMPLLRYRGKDVVLTSEFLYDLTNSIVTSGLAMIISGNTRVSSGAEHLISHAIDEYFPERATIHGIQVGWAHLLVDRDWRNDIADYTALQDFYASIGLVDVIKERIKWKECEFSALVPYARRIRNRYTIFSAVSADKDCAMKSVESRS